MITDPDILKKLIEQGSLLPQEETLELGRKRARYLSVFRRKHPIRSVEYHWFQRRYLCLLLMVIGLE